VSDCWAIHDIHSHHKLTNTPEESAIAALKAGTDLDCGEVYYPGLLNALKQGRINEADIDVSLKRLFSARMKLGMFDDPDNVPYTKIAYDVVDSERHRDLALESARKSIVLLKNDNNTLPLDKDIQTLAVIGPNSDQWLVLLGNYNGVPSDPVTPLRGIREKIPNANVIYEQGSDLVEGQPVLSLIPERVLKTPSGLPGLKAEYFNSSSMEGEVVFSETHTNLNSNWNDKSPREDLNDDDFAVRWTGSLTPEKSGRYLIGLNSTCNTNVYIDGKLVRDTTYHFRNEYGDPRLKKSNWLNLEAGRSYHLKVEAKETYADAQVFLSWSEPDLEKHQRALDAAKSADAVVMFMGLAPHIEGEEMKVEVDGFSGGDRTRLGLPDVQEQLIKDIHALGKPVVLVLLNGGALAVNWAHDHVPAIVEAWYPGQAGGTAIADVLFGDFNPGGRLPITFYKSLENFPAFDNYNITTQTYRYFKGEPLYPFGYGLSYSKFEYGDLEVSAQLKLGSSLLVKATITNSSKIAGEEVVQVYLQNKAADSRVPLRALVGFERVFLEGGETRTVEIIVDAKDFAHFDSRGKRQYARGKFVVSIGGGR